MRLTNIWDVVRMVLAVTTEEEAELLVALWDLRLAQVRSIGATQHDAWL